MSGADQSAQEGLLSESSDEAVEVCYHIGVDVGTTIVRCGVFKCESIPPTDAGSAGNGDDGSDCPGASATVGANASARKISSTPKRTDAGTSSTPRQHIRYTTEEVCVSSRSISRHNPCPAFYEQNSEEIWWAVCHCVRTCLVKANLQNSPEKVKSIGFDATCSLVVLGAHDRSLPVRPKSETDPSLSPANFINAAEQAAEGLEVNSWLSPAATKSGGVSAVSALPGKKPGAQDHKPGRRFDIWNVIMWMDHRAVKQAERINSKKHPLLKLVGGKISPEMEMPKILWLKEKCPLTYYSARKFMDLADFLTYRATGVDRRSICTLTCKANWAHPEVARRGILNKDCGGCLKEFLFEIGLQDLDLEALGGDRVAYMGTPISRDGLTAQAARDFGLATNTVVGVGLIDAHAGGLGVIGLLPMASKETTYENEAECCERHKADVEKRVCMITGTSTCFLFTSREPVSCKGVWGPYYGSMIPRCWLLEGGQSASGAFLEWLVQSHPARLGFEGLPDHLYRTLSANLLNCYREQAQSQRMQKSESGESTMYQYEINASCGDIFEKTVPLYDKHGSQSDVAARTLTNSPHQTAGSSTAIAADASTSTEAGSEWSHCGMLSRSVHLTPDVYGNRSPYADPDKRSVRLGCALDCSLDDLSIHYLAALQALAYGARDVLETVEAAGHPPAEVICLCGRFSSNELFVQQVADICQRPVMVSQDSIDAALLGSAILGCAAWITKQAVDGCKNEVSGELETPVVDVYNAGVENVMYERLCGRSVLAAATRMCRRGRIIKPTTDEYIKDYHNRKYTVFKKMLKLEDECRDIMKQDE